MPDLGAHQLHRRADGGAGVEVLGVAVAGDDLGGRHRRQPERGTHLGLHCGVHVGVGPDGARQLAHRHRGARRAHATAVAVGLERPERELGPEGRGLGVHAVGPPRHRDVQELERPRLESVDERVEVGEDQVGRRGQRGRQRGVHDVRGGEPVVDPRPRRRADALLYDVDERRHVVVGHLLPLGHLGHQHVVDHGRLGPARRGVLGRDDAQSGQGFGRQQLHLEPAGETGRVAEQRRHVRRRVPWDHDTAAAMSWRICRPSQSIPSAAS